MLRPNEASMSSETQRRTSSSQLSIVAAVAAGLCWSGVIVLLYVGNLQAEALVAPQRLMFYALVLMAGLLTFVPIERASGIAGLTIYGTASIALLCYTLAFVPAPHDSLLSLPDMPVYFLLLLAVFGSATAVATPFVYAIGRRVFRQRARQGDLGRTRRQAAEIGVFAAATVALASLRVLTWVSLLLLALILVIAELLFLSRVEVAE
jgi:membrane glycosyltransferase